MKCMHCGAEVNSEEYCPECGEKLSNNVVFTSFRNDENDLEADSIVNEDYNKQVFICDRCKTPIVESMYTLGTIHLCEKCGDDLGLEEEEKRFIAPIGIRILQILMWGTYALSVAGIITNSALEDLADAYKTLKIAEVCGIILLCTLVCAILHSLLNTVIHIAEIAYNGRQLNKKIDKIYNVSHWKL